MRNTASARLSLLTGNLMQTDQLLAGVVVLSMLGLCIGYALSAWNAWPLALAIGDSLSRLSHTMLLYSNQDKCQRKIRR